MDFTVTVPIVLPDRERCNLSLTWPILMGWVCYSSEPIYKLWAWFAAKQTGVHFCIVLICWNFVFLTPIEPSLLTLSLPLLRNISIGCPGSWPSYSPRCLPMIVLIISLAMFHFAVRKIRSQHWRTPYIGFFDFEDRRHRSVGL